MQPDVEMSLAPAVRSQHHQGTTAKAEEAESLNQTIQAEYTHIAIPVLLK